MHKNRSRDDATSTDDEVTFDSFADEIRSLLSAIQDQGFALSLVAAVDVDHALFQRQED